MKPIIKFMVAGGIGFVINTVILFILTDKFNIFYMISALISIQSSIFGQFVLNNTWTFKNKINNTFFQSFIKYESVCVIGAILNYIIMVLLTELFGIYYLLSNFISVIIVFFINYYNSKKYVWIGKNN